MKRFLSIPNYLSLPKQNISFWPKLRLPEIHNYSCYLCPKLQQKKISFLIIFLETIITWRLFSKNSKHCLLSKRYQRLLFINFVGDSFPDGDNFLETFLRHQPPAQSICTRSLSFSHDLIHTIQVRWCGTDIEHVYFAGVCDYIVIFHVAIPGECIVQLLSMVLESIATAILNMQNECLNFSE